MNYIIKTFDKSFKIEPIQNFLKEIAIIEFGFNDWNNYFDSMKFLPKTNKDIFFIAYNEKKEIIGTIGVTYQTDNEAKIHSLYVRKDCRNNGIGKALYKKAIDFIKTKYYNKIILHTYDKFENAIKFYKKEGFIQYDNLEDEEGIWFKKNI